MFDRIKAKEVDLSTRQVPVRTGLVPQMPGQSIPAQDSRVPVKETLGASAGVTGQSIVIGTTAVLIVPPRKRLGIRLTNLTPVEIWYGFDQTVTPTTGDLLCGGRGQWVEVETQTPIWAVIAAGLGTGNGQLSWVELYE